MKYVFITYSGLALPVALKLQQEGNDVVVGWIEDIRDYVMEDEVRGAKEDEAHREKRLRLFRNMLNFKSAHEVVEMVQKAKNPHEYFVFFEENNLYRWADKVKDLGVEGTFPTKEDFLLEIDREAAKKFVSEHYPKLYVPEVREFAKVSEAIEFLQKTTEVWVLKGKDDKAKTFVPSVVDPEFAKGQIIEMLQNFPSKYEYRGFILELFIPSIIELTPEKMYYDGVPLCTTIDFENKSFGSGNISVQTGCAQDMVFPTDMEDRINKLCFPPVVDEMARQHKGLFVGTRQYSLIAVTGKCILVNFVRIGSGIIRFLPSLHNCRQ
jgi:hypothetical protein